MKEGTKDKQHRATFKAQIVTAALSEETRQAAGRNQQPASQDWAVAA
ncbi:MAG: hypothetical protein WBH99_03165 [Azovibrio sp.]